MVVDCPNCGRGCTYEREWKHPGVRVDDDEAGKCYNCGHAFKPEDSDAHDDWHAHRKRVLQNAGLWDEYRDEDPTDPPGLGAYYG